MTASTRIRSSLTSLLALAALASSVTVVSVACSSSPSDDTSDGGTASDAATGSDSSTATGDGGKTDGATGDAAATECKVDPAPAGVKRIAAKWVILGTSKNANGDGGAGEGGAGDGGAGEGGAGEGGGGGDGGGDGGGGGVWTVPTMTGGDPKGVWTVDSATFYLPEVASGVVDTAASTAVGSAWAVVEPSNYRFFASFDTLLDTNVVGKVSTKTENTSKGAYTVQGSTLKFAPVCSGGSQGASPDLEFSVNGTRGQLLSKITTQLGQLIVVFDGSIAAN